MAYDVSFVGYQKPASIHNQAAGKFGQVLKEKLGDEVEFTLTGDVTTLGYKQFERDELVSDGTFACWYQSSSYFTTHGVPECGVLDLPFVFESQAHAYRVLDGALGKIIAEKINQETPFHFLGFWDNGYRHFSNSVRPIRTPEDCKGIRVRTLTSPLHGEAFRALGMKTDVMDIATLLERAAAGTIDAQENPLTNTFNFGIQKLQPFITMTGHIWGGTMLLVNKQVFDGWPAHVQSAMYDAGKVATAFQRDLALNEDARILNNLDDENVEIIQLSPEERELFVAAVQPVIESHRAEFGDYLEMIAAAR